jgi:hypothetical protein
MNLSKRDSVVSENGSECAVGVILENARREQDRSDVIAPDDFDEPGQVIRVWVREYHDIERSVPEPHDAPEFFKHRIRRPAIEKHLKPLWCFDEERIALTDIKHDQSERFRAYPRDSCNKNPAACNEEHA